LPFAAPLLLRSAMGHSNPWLLLLLLGGTVYVGRLWWTDYRAARNGSPTPHPLPGATPASFPALGVAATGAGLLLVLETGGEHALGLVGEQSRVTVLFGIYTLAAAFLEELIFRGYVVVPDRGRAVLAASCITASLLFALLHPFLWEWKDGALIGHFGLKAWFSTAAIFAGSLWFYFVRFSSLNPSQSLLPCFVAHATKNLGVFAIKAAQGYVEGLF